MCRGCFHDFTHEGCRRFAKARVLRLLRIGWDADPTVEENYEVVMTLHCWAAPGHFGHFDAYPTCVNLTPKPPKKP